MANPWSKIEVEATVADYFDMLGSEVRGEPYSKTAHRKALRQRLESRSDGAIERKHQNISAVLIEIGYVYISGYKPLGNYQALLKDVVLQRVANSSTLELDIEAQVTADARVPEVVDILSALVEPPKVNAKSPQAVREERSTTAPILGKDYLAMEANNRSLGLAGEKFVVNFEQARLLAAGKDNLASDVEHVSQTKGDGLGYDILSFEIDGRERLIEAKTTAYGANAPFYVSRREVQASIELADQYYLYRVFQFRKQPKLYERFGSIDSAFSLTPMNFSAVPR